MKSDLEKSFDRYLAENGFNRDKPEPFKRSTFVAKRQGVEEGDICRRQGCRGTIVIVPDGDCRCSTMNMPPCGPCESSYHWCEGCGWSEDHAS